jgi:hypothetical protein
VEEAFRFYVLYDKICREDILRHAYGLARGNAGHGRFRGRTPHALNAVLADTTFRPALFDPPSAARLKTAAWSPGVLDVDFALIATPKDTVTETGSVMDHPPVQLGVPAMGWAFRRCRPGAPHSSGIPALRRPAM